MKNISLKYFIFSSLVLLVIILFFRLLFLFFIYPNSIYLIKLGIIYLILLVFISLFFFLIDNRYFIYSTLSLSAFSFLIFFPFSNVYFLTGFLVLLLLGIGYECSRYEKKQRIKLSLGKTCSKGLPFVILAMSLLLSVIYYFNPLLMIDQQELEIPPRTFRPLAIFLNKMFLDILPADLSQTELINLEYGAIENQLAANVNQNLKEFIVPHSQEISVGLAVALFLALRVVGIILAIIAVILARIIFYILFICKATKINSQMKSIEVIRF